MAHEIAHAFDTDGRQFDSNGEFRNWWGLNSTQFYQDQTQCLVDQYNQFSVTLEEGRAMHVDGNKTVDENIADALGFQHAWATWKATGQSKLVLPSFTQYSEDQLFFLAMGLNHCSKSTHTEMEDSQATPNHAPGFARLNGIAMNSREFAQAFQCPVGSPMNPIKKCRFWSSSAPERKDDSERLL
jgi:predicted metalloendopeptidase